MAEGKVRDLFPQGTALRDAVRWISDRRKTEPDTRLVRLIDEACIRFDLTPQESTFLYRALVEEAPSPLGE